MSDSTPSYIPSEIHLIASKEGVISIKHTLLGVTKRDGWFDLFYMVPERVLVKKNTDYQETIEFIRRFTEPETVELDQKNHEIYCNGVVVGMGVAEFAFYMWMCQRKLAGELPLNLDEDEFMCEYLEVYSKFTHREGGMFDRAEAVAKEGDIVAQKKWFSQRKSKVNGCIGSVLGKRLAAPFFVQSAGKRGRLSYEVGFAQEAIRLR